MESIQLSSVIKEVKIILNENIVEDNFLAIDSNQLELNELIEARIVDAVRFVHENASREYLSEGLPLSGTPITSQDGTGYLNLPADFLRLVVFQMEGWNIGVFEVISDDDPLYAVQKSKFLGVRGGPNKPVCAITYNPGGQTLEYYSVRPGTAGYIKKARYLPVPLKEGTSIKICPKLKNAVYYYCAGLVAAVFKNEVSTSLFEISKNYM
jgi:hypothetical protein